MTHCSMCVLPKLQRRCISTGPNPLVLLHCMNSSQTRPDRQCGTAHAAPPGELDTPSDVVVICIMQHYYYFRPRDDVSG